MNDIQKQYEKETKLEAIEEHCDIEGQYNIYSKEYTEWLEKENTKLKQQIRDMKCQLQDIFNSMEIKEEL